MPVSRRAFLGAVPAVLAAQPAAINRRDVVSRHNPTLRGLDPRSPLSVGNGEFAFTADPTGLQTFPQPYETQMPLCTQSQWGWHTAPNPTGKGPADLRLTNSTPSAAKSATPHRATAKASSSTGSAKIRTACTWAASASPSTSPTDVRFIQQTLDLWTGTLHSEFEWQRPEDHGRNLLPSHARRDRRTQSRAASPWSSSFPTAPAP